jgi:hypothetical protein
VADADKRFGTGADARGASGAQTAVGTSGGDTTQQPHSGPKKVAAGEEQKQPNRRFTGTLLHNLGDDLKHMPRRNSLYCWLPAAR